MKAVQQWDDGSRVAQTPNVGSIFDQVLWDFRCAFFRDCRDIARWDVQCEIGKAHDVDIVAIEQCIHDGDAFARLAADYQDADKMRIEGSPSFVLNEGRQKLAHLDNDPLRRASEAIGGRIAAAYWRSSDA
jgi:protein-disulfide isomerase-like protein with CxxC motif